MTTETLNIGFRYLRYEKSQDWADIFRFGYNRIHYRIKLALKKAAICFKA